RPPLHPQIDELVGSFTSLVLLEVDGASAPGFAGRARAVQEQLWRDLEHREVPGMDVLRELNRTRGGVATMPVVFTSTLALRRAFGRVAPAPARTVFSCAQTPQVWLEHLVLEENGELVLVWDSVDELFEPGMLDAMFAAYGALV